MPKHIYVKPQKGRDAPLYTIFIYGSLWRFEKDKERPYVTSVSLTANEIKELLSLNNLKRYQRCKALYKSKDSESNEQKKFLSKEQQLELKALFP